MIDKILCYTTYQASLKAFEKIFRIFYPAERDWEEVIRMPKGKGKKKAPAKKKAGGKKKRA